MTISIQRWPWLEVMDKILDKQCFSLLYSQIRTGALVSHRVRWKTTGKLTNRLEWNFVFLPSTWQSSTKKFSTLHTGDQTCFVPMSRKKQARQCNILKVRMKNSHLWVRSTIGFYAKHFRDLAQNKIKITANVFVLKLKFSELQARGPLFRIGEKTLKFT